MSIYPDIIRDMWMLALLVAILAEVTKGSRFWLYMGGAPLFAIIAAYLDKIFAY